MRIRIGITSIFFVVLTLNADANLKYRKGDTLFVWAVHGLNIRQSPKGKIIHNLPYGSRIKMLQDHDPSQLIPMEVLPSVKIKNEEYPGITIYGRYVEVEAGDVKGYVFDAYLSKLPPIKAINQYNELEHLEQYFFRSFGILKELKNEKSARVPEYRFIYNNGASCEFERQDSGGTQTIIIPDFTISEAFIFLNRIYNFDRDYRKSAESGYFKVMESKRRYFLFSSITETMGAWEIGNYVVIEISGGD